MDVLLGIAIALLAVGIFAATLLVFPAMREGFRGQWKRFPPKARRRGVVAGAATAVYVVAGAAFAIAAPWGQTSVLYVMGLGGGALVFLMFAGVVIQALNGSRRARQR
jgi:hypothetical protein